MCFSISMLVITWVSAPMLKYYIWDMGQCHHHFMSSLYARRAQKPKKDSQLKQLWGRADGIGRRAQTFLCQGVQSDDIFINSLFIDVILEYNFWVTFKQFHLNRKSSLIIIEDETHPNCYYHTYSHKNPSLSRPFHWAEQLISNIFLSTCKGYAWVISLGLNLIQKTQLQNIFESNSPPNS